MNSPSAQIMNTAASDLHTTDSHFGSDVPLLDLTFALRNHGRNPDQDTKIAELLSALPGKTSTSKLSSLMKNLPFETLYEDRYTKLEFCVTDMGPTVRCTFRRGTSVGDAMNEINRACLERHGVEAIYRGVLFNINGDPLLAKNRSRAYIFFPYVEGSNNREKYGQDPNTSMEGFLNSHGLRFVSRELLAIAAGAYRTAVGFRNSLEDCSGDAGDIFDGYIVRAEGKKQTIANYPRRGVAGGVYFRSEKSFCWSLYCAGLVTEYAPEV